jgi:hypothetical protein
MLGAAGHSRELSYPNSVRTIAFARMGAWASFIRTLALVAYSQRPSYAKGVINSETPIRSGTVHRKDVLTARLQWSQRGTTALPRPDAEGVQNRAQGVVNQIREGEST